MQTQNLKIRARLNGLGHLDIDYYEAGEWRGLDMIRLDQPCKWKEYAKAWESAARARGVTNFDFSLEQ